MSAAARLCAEWHMGQGPPSLPLWCSVGPGEVTVVRGVGPLARSQWVLWRTRGDGKGVGEAADQEIECSLGMPRGPPCHEVMLCRGAGAETRLGGKGKDPRSLLLALAGVRAVGGFVSPQRSGTSVCSAESRCLPCVPAERGSLFEDTCYHAGLTHSRFCCRSSGNWEDLPV